LPLPDTLFCVCLAGLPRYGANVRLRVSFLKTPTPVDGHRGWSKLATLGDEPQFLAVNKRGRVAMWEHEIDAMLEVAPSVAALRVPTKTVARFVWRR
jgi:hypothetical protein